MSAESIAVVAGIVLSLVFSYVPKLKDWYDGLEGNKRRLLMLGLLTGVALGAFGLACADLVAQVGIGVLCTKAGAFELLRSLVYAIIANQSTFMISPKTKGYKEKRNK
jgi:O-phosphoseryl-tRNA(Cys) synthetase